MSNFQKILASFDLRDTLNPKVWENPEDPKKATMIPKVRKALLRIANEFIDDLGENVFVEDIYLMGSLSNFNWSDYSDFDLHVIVDMDRYGKQEKLYEELFDLKKKVFNDKHDIKIFGYDVELYAQGSKAESHSDGVFSVMSNEWIHRPTKKQKNIDREVLTKKIKSWTDKIDDAIEDAKTDKNVSKLKQLKDKLKDYRQSGLSKEGEFSYENLVFKFLRRSGHIEKLFKEKTKIKDKDLSIEQQLQEVAKSDELFGGADVTIPRDGAHAGQSGWHSANAWDIKAKIGEPVYALAGGTVKTYSDHGPNIIRKDGKKIYGIGFTVDSDGGLPDVFYTHLQNAQVRKGSRVECGQLLGYVMDMPNSSYDHVHIGVEWGHNIREFLNPDGTLKCAKGVKIGRYGKSFEDESENPVWDKMDKSNFLQKMYVIAQAAKTFEYKPGKIQYDPDVETIQTALQFLGFSLPKWGVDGKYGPETKNAVTSFQSKLGMSEDGKLEANDLRYLVGALLFFGFQDSDLTSIQKNKEIEVGGLTDKNFYERLLKELGAPVTNENLKFLYAWRQAEGKGGRNNPFNTTLKMPGSTKMNYANVQHYPTKEDGLIATIKTLKNGRYNCIVNGLKNDIGAAQISKCPSLEVWGTGDLVAKVVNSYEKGASPKIKDLA